MRSERHAGWRFLLGGFVRKGAGVQAAAAHAPPLYLETQEAPPRISRESRPRYCCSCHVANWYLSRTRSSQGELPEPAKSLFRQAVRQLPEAKFRRLGAAGPGAGPGTLGRKKRLIHSFSALILVSNAKVILASPFLKLDAPSAAPGWPVERRSVCSALCGVFRGSSLPMLSRGGKLLGRLVGRPEGSRKVR